MRWKLLPWSDPRINLSGRSRSLARELERLQETAGHIDDLAFKTALAVKLQGAEPDFAEVEAQRRNLIRDLEQLRRAAKALAEGGEGAWRRERDRNARTLDKR